MSIRCFCVATKENKAFAALLRATSKTLQNASFEKCLNKNLSTLRPTILSQITKRLTTPSTSVLSQKFSSEGSVSSKNDENEEKVEIGAGTWEEVYRGVLTTQIRLVKTFSLTTSAIGLAIQPILAQELAGNHLSVAIACGTMLGFFTFVTPLLIHFISKKYVTKMEYDSIRDLYSATTISFFLKEKKMTFKPSDVTVPDVPGMFTTFHVKNKALFVQLDTFTDVNHYARLMGYDKPINFHLNENNEKDN